MKIEFNPGNYQINPYRKNYNKSVNRKKISNDTVEISDDALKMLSNKDEIRNQKISQLKNEISENKYQINTERIVDKMVRNAYLNFSSKKE